MTTVTADHDTGRRPADNAEGPTPAPGWPIAGTCFGIVFALFLALYHETLLGLIGIYSVSETFGHGFLIPLVSAVLIWYRRNRLLAATPKPALLGFIGLIGLTTLWFVARLADVQLVEHAAFVAAIPCLVLAVLGWGVVRAILFPLFYLIFMIPFGEFMIPPLQNVTADFVVWWLRLIGIPIFRDGIFLHIPSGSFEVAEACAGLRFLIAMIVLGVLFANVTFYTTARRLMFLALAVIIPIIANGFRALMIVLIAYWSDHTIAVGVDHIVFGWVFLTFVTILILLTGMAMRERAPPARSDDDRPPGPPPPASRPALAAATVASLLILTSAPAFAYWRATHPPDASALRLALPAEAMGWTLQDDPPDLWRPVFVGADDETLVRFVRGDRWVEVYVGYYAYQRRNAEVVNYLNTLHRLAEQPEGATSQLDGVPDPWSRVADYRFDLPIDGGPGQVTGVHLRALNNDRRLVLPLYWVGGALTQSGIEAKLLQLQAVFSGESEAAAGVVLATPFTEDPQDAAETLRAFAEVMPSIRTALTNALLETGRDGEETPREPALEETTVSDAGARRNRPGGDTLSSVVD